VVVPKGQKQFIDQHASKIGSDQAIISNGLVQGNQLK
jgi:hypothetical protein